MAIDAMSCWQRIGLPSLPACCWKYLHATGCFCQYVHCLQDLEGQIANFGDTKGKRIQAAQNKVAAAKTTLEKAKSAAKTAAQAHLQAVAEGEAAAGERKSLAAQLQVTQQAIQGTRQCDLMCVGYEQPAALLGKLCLANGN